MTSIYRENSSRVLLCGLILRSISEDGGSILGKELSSALKRENNSVLTVNSIPLLAIIATHGNCEAFREVLDIDSVRTLKAPVCLRVFSSLAYHGLLFQDLRQEACNKASSSGTCRCDLNCEDFIRNYIIKPQLSDKNYSYKDIRDILNSEKRRDRELSDDGSNIVPQKRGVNNSSSSAQTAITARSKKSRLTLGPDEILNFLAVKTTPLDQHPDYRGVVSTNLKKHQVNEIKKTDWIRIILDSTGPACLERLCILDALLEGVQQSDWKSQLECMNLSSEALRHANRAAFYYFAVRGQPELRLDATRFDLDEVLVVQNKIPDTIWEWLKTQCQMNRWEKRTTLEIPEDIRNMLAETEKTITENRVLRAGSKISKDLQKSELHLSVRDNM